MINPKARHDPRDVISWGRAAAMLYLNKAYPLSQAVYDVVKDKSVTTEHVQRILEVANITAYLAEYERMKGPSKIVSFPGGPATIKKVMALMDKERGGEDMSHKDYDEPPVDYKATKVAAHLEGLNDGQMEKMAGDVNALQGLDQISMSQPPPDTLDSLFFKLGAAITQLEEEVVKASADRWDLESKLHVMLKEAAVDGNSLGDIRRAASVTEDPALDNMLIKIANEVTYLFPDEERVLQSFSKVSHNKETDPSHPIREVFGAYRQALNDIKTKVASIEILKKHQEKIVSLKGGANA